jgi:hypothetical protein
MQPQRLAAKALAAAAILVGLMAGPAAAATWTIVPSQAVGSGSVLSGIDALSATDAWAVGGSGNGLVEHWNGTNWATVASPDLIGDHSNPSNTAGLSAVDATSATNAFAVGSAHVFGTSSSGGAVALRFNGTSWSKTTVPGPAGQSLNDVKAFSPTDAWAVGHGGTSTLGLTLARHWQGSSWTQVATPSPGTRDNVLLGVAGTSPSDVWAVGWYRDLPYGNRAQHSLVLHWNGSAWSRVTSPDVGNAQTVLKDVIALSPTDAWAVGYTDDFGGATRATALHWNGTSWTVSPAPALGTLDAVTALSPTDIWASGTDANGRLQFANWRGSGWTVTAAPTPSGTGTPALTTLSAVAPGTVWAVGSVWDGTNGTGKPLVMRTTNG